jgi:hypothetical protein
MLKLYVETIYRLGRSTRFITERIEARKDEAGFAAAENIALAVAGVLIVGLVFTFFREAIIGDGTPGSGLLGKVTTSFTSIEE